MTNHCWCPRKTELRKGLRRGGWALLIMSLLPLSALAGLQFNADERIVVPTQNQMNESWYAAAQEMNVTGHLLKHSFLAASQLIFAGIADQDLNLAFQLGTVSGIVGGDLRIVGDIVKVSTRVGQNLVVVGRDVTLEPSAFVKDGLAVAGKKVIIAGTVQGKSDLVGETVEINGTLLGDAVVRAKTLTLGPAAHISGKLTYSADHVVDLPAGVSAGQTQRLDAQTGTSENSWYSYFGKISADKLFGVLFSFTFLVVSVLLIWVWPKAAQRYGDAVGRSVWISLGWGLLLLIGVPMAVILLAVSLVGIPLALLMTVVYLMGLFFSKLGVSCWLGGLLLFRWKHKKTMVLFLAGYALLLVVGLIPVLGTLVSWLAMIIGLGALIMVRHSDAPAAAGIPAGEPVPVVGPVTAPLPTAPVSLPAPQAHVPAPAVKTVPAPRPMTGNVVVPKRPMATVATRVTPARKPASVKPKVKPVRKAVAKKATKSVPKRRTR